MKKAIIVDLDGTLANCEHRLPFIREKKPKDWKSFHGGVYKDAVNGWCKSIVNMVGSGYEVIIISGRTEETLVQTENWLDLNDIKYDQLYVRGFGDYRDDHIVKKERYEKHVKGKYEVLFVIEDRKRVVDMWRSEGLVCLQCAEGNY